MTVVLATNKVNAMVGAAVELWCLSPVSAAAGLCCRIARLPAQGVVNRDIKLENTLLDSSPRPLVKICDFGYSKVHNDGLG